ncbi:MAG: cache domain-containing protein, partial [Candidatus Marinimicrobia bacterium]|nr:cache domain-containing protein [Candidatus Neomarinimicrobiota bacterium]
WKDDSTKIVPKLSFVKGFKQWGWVIGTGIYM